jgi:nitrous oxidase accessory protein NosD
MNKSVRIAFTASILFFLICSCVLGALVEVKAIQTIVVPDDYLTVKEAILNSSNGDVIYVKAGIYRENLIIDKSIELIGQDSKTTQINGIYYSLEQDTILVAADNVTVSGFTIVGSGTSVGIRVERMGLSHQPKGCRVIGNTITNASTGIHLYGTSNPTTGKRYPSDTLIAENNITKNSNYGIYCTTSNTTISKNIIEENEWEGIIIDECVNVTVKENIIKGNSRGLLLRWWGPFSISGNNISEMNTGIVFGEYCNNASISENNIFLNEIGIHLEDVGNADLIGSGNVVYRNNLYENDRQVVVSPNCDFVSWDKGQEGNYWDTYIGEDPDGNGIGKTPFLIDADIKDNYPQMRLVNFSDFPPNPTLSPFESPSTSVNPSTSPNPISEQDLPQELLYGIIASLAIAVAILTVAVVTLAYKRK